MPGASVVDVASASVLGADLHLLTTEELTEVVGDLAGAGRRAVIANHNLHSLYLLRSGVPGLAELYAAADVVHVDGMLLCLLGRLAGHPVRREHRTTYLDWVGPLGRMCAERGLRVALVGGRPGVADQAARRLSDSSPGLRIVGTSHGYFDVTSEEACEAVEADLASWRPDVVLVGMGMPRQELWFSSRREQLPPATYLMAGGCFDYLAGVTATPPRWMGQVGLEWLYRLVGDPRRLWRRYLVEPVLLLGLLARDRAR